MNELQRNVALFRYSLVREAADESLTIRQRGQLVRELAAREHTGPNGQQVRVSRGTVDRWIRDYRAGGFDALAPVPRKVEPMTEPRLLDWPKRSSGRFPVGPRHRWPRSSAPPRGKAPPSAPSSVTSPVWG